MGHTLLRLTKEGPQIPIFPFRICQLYSRFGISYIKNRGGGKAFFCHNQGGAWTFFTKFEGGQAKKFKPVMGFLSRLARLSMLPPYVGRRSHSDVPELLLSSSDPFFYESRDLMVSTRVPKKRIFESQNSQNSDKLCFGLTQYQIVTAAAVVYKTFFVQQSSSFVH